MDKFLLIFIGGGIGAYARFLISSIILEPYGPIFPLGTLTVKSLWLLY